MYIAISRLSIRIESQLIPEQHGFRKDKSCSTALRLFTNFLYTAIDQKKGRAVAVFVDLRKAFDSVDLRKAFVSVDLRKAFDSVDLRKAFDSVDQSLLIQKLMFDFHVEP
jgi:hypothetical protein